MSTQGVTRNIRKKCTVSAIPDMVHTYTHTHTERERERERALKTSNISFAALNKDNKLIYFYLKRYNIIHKIKLASFLLQR